MRTIKTKLLGIFTIGFIFTNITACSLDKDRLPVNRTKQNKNSDYISSLYLLSKLKYRFQSLFYTPQPQNAYAESVAFKPNLINVKVGDKYGYTNHQGTMVIPPIFDSSANFKAGYAKVRYNNKDGIINRQGEIVIPFDFSAIHKSYVSTLLISSNGVLQGHLVAAKDAKWGVIDTDGNTIISFKFDEISYYSPKFTLVKNKNVMGFVNRQNDFVPLVVKDNGDYFSEGVAILRHHDHWQDRYCAVNKQGKLLIPFISSRPDKAAKMNNACRSLARIKVNNSSIENPEDNGNYIQETSFEQYFKDGLLRVLINDRYGYLNLDSQLVIPPLYESAGYFAEGLAAVKKENSFRFIDKTGKTVFLADNYLPYSQYMSGSMYKSPNCLQSPAPHTFSEFENNLAIVSKINNSGKLDRNGCFPIGELNYYYLNRQNKIITDNLIQATFVEALEIAPDLFKIKTDKGYGILKRSGEIVARPIFEYIGDFEEGVAPVKTVSSDRSAWIDLNGKFTAK